MARKGFCQGCTQKDNCQGISEQMEESAGSSVTLNVILAFLLPLLVFIISLAVFEKVLAGTFNAGRMRTVVSFLLALLVTFACILITRVISKSFSSDK
jgi:uncharacterized membrane protein